MTLTNERYEEIKRIVVEVFKKYKISCVPVSGFELAVKLGIKIIPYSNFSERKQILMLKKSEDGFCVEKDVGEWFIFYNDSMPYPRINNTFMHEIGHIVLDHSEDSELAEAEVKFFAKYALAPPVLIHKFQLKNPEQVADVFEISYTAARYAYTYYQKWLAFGPTEFTDYEIELLNLFEAA